jgi:release factor glutamine methyltransferase
MGSIRSLPLKEVLKETLFKESNYVKGVEVYEPREDSYMLAEIVEELVYGKVLDMGTGSGIQAITAALKPEVKEVTAADINPEALRRAEKRAKSENVGDKVTFIQSDLFQNLSGKFDWIIFNPPYLPSEGEVDELSWVGGEKGFEVIETFLVEASKYLEEDGSILLVHSSLTKLKIDERDYWVEVLVEKELFYEKLVIVKLSHL